MNALPRSFAESLEQAKRLFRQENFSAAKLLYERVAMNALVSAPDMWIDATYGMAECLRLNGQFDEAMLHYRTVLERGLRMPLPTGRYAEADRMAMINSFRAIAHMCRLSLRVSSESIFELLTAGQQWASATPKTNHATSALFDQTRLQLEQNMLDDDQVVTSFADVVGRLEAIQQPGIVDDVVADLQLTRMKLNAGFKQRPSVPPPSTHPVFKWASTMNVLLTAQWQIAKGRPKTALKTLNSLSLNLRPFDSYPELKPYWLGLRCQCELKARLLPTTMPELSRLIQAEINRAIKHPGDLSTHFWHLLSLIKHSISPSKRPFHWLSSTNISELAEQELQPLLYVFREVLTTPWIQQTLKDRGLRYTYIERSFRWIAQEHHDSAWQREGIAIIRPIIIKVRP